MTKKKHLMIRSLNLCVCRRLMPFNRKLDILPSKYSHQNTCVTSILENCKVGAVVKLFDWQTIIDIHSYFLGSLKMHHKTNIKNDMLSKNINGENIQ